MAQKLELGDYDTEIIRYAAILHDIGHGPFSHNFEAILEFVNKRDISHEDITRKIIEADKGIYTVLRKGMDALEGYRLVRYLMHTQVYYHHARAISDSMLQRAVEVAVRDGALDNKMLKIDDPHFLANYLSLDNNRLFQKIRS